MSNAILAFGATVEISANGTTGWAAVPELTSVAVPATTQDYVDVTNLDSTGGYREYIPGLKDAGQLSLSANYTADAYSQMAAYQTSGDIAYFRVTLNPQPNQSTGDVFQFAGYVTVSVEAGDVAGKVSMTINLRISGAVTWTEGAA